MKIPEEFRETVVTLLATYGRLYSPETAAKAVLGYWWTLEAEELPDIARAAKEATRILDRCPTPKDILELCQDYRRRREKNTTREITPEERRKAQAEFYRQLERVNGNA